jgi:hypothetical protein
MEFKVGDKVVCIDNNGKNNLILNKTYTIKRCVMFADTARISLVEFPISAFFTNRFKLLSEVRKEKLKQLRNEI